MMGEMSASEPREEDIARLLAMLPPAPPAWVEAAKQLPELRRRIDEVLARAETDKAFRAALAEDPRNALRDVGLEPDEATMSALRDRLESA